MNENEFKSFTKIKRLAEAEMAITQKIHGTNAQIHVFQKEGVLDLKVGCRTRWIRPEKDNFGFAKFVYDNKQEFIEKLGMGTHYGEWAGPGINSGEGLTEKTFILFDFWKWPSERPLPPQTKVVPLLYRGGLDISKIEECSADLKSSGSKLVPGFMRPEGVVVTLCGVRYKKVFDPEDTKWTEGPKHKNKESKIHMDFSALLQPIRLEKLLSKDENYIRDYPTSLITIVNSYFMDLVEERQVMGTEEEIETIRKLSSSQIFNFVKSQVRK